MNLDDWKFIFISFSIILIIIAFLPVSNAIISEKEEQFITLATLGEDNRADEYYPNNDPFIDIGAIMNWSIYVHNNMGETKYISLRIKFLNFTTRSPNSTSYIPSSSPVTYEIQRIVKNKETYIFPLTWSIITVDYEQKNANNFTYIKSIIINEEMLNTYIVSLNGQDYKMVIEFWLYDDILRDFSFQWNDGLDDNCVWNQIWFNINNSEL